MVIHAVLEHPLGRVSESQRALDELIAKYGSRIPFVAAMAYAWIGETVKLIGLLDRSLS